MSKRLNIKSSYNKRLYKRRKLEIKKLLSDRYSINKDEKLVNFLSLYIDCEALAKKLVQYYRIDKKTKKSISNDSINCDEINKAIKHFSLQIDEKLIKGIFLSGTGKRGFKTPRQLRNGIVHSKSAKDIEEVRLRTEELQNIMKIWIEKIIETLCDSD